MIIQEGTERKGLYFLRKNDIMKSMETIIRKTDEVNMDKQAVAEAGAILKQGGLVAFPTETVYGLGQMP